MPRKSDPNSVAGRIRRLLESCPTLTNAELFAALLPSVGNVNPRWLRTRICDMRGLLKRELAKKGRR